MYVHATYTRKIHIDLPAHWIGIYGQFLFEKIGREYLLSEVTLSIYTYIW